MSALDSATIERFETAVVSGRLRDLAEELKGEGLSQPAIYIFFESYWKKLGDLGRARDEDMLLDAMECIVGYCAPSSRWFDSYLTNEEIDAYRKLNG